MYNIIRVNIDLQTSCTHTENALYIYMDILYTLYLGGCIYIYKWENGPVAAAAVITLRNFFVRERLHAHTHKKRHCRQHALAPSCPNPRHSTHLLRPFGVIKQQKHTTILLQLLLLSLLLLLLFRSTRQYYIIYYDEKNPRGNDEARRCLREKK